MGMPKILPIEQGSKEWLAMKFTHIGGSYAPIIMGDSPYMTLHELWVKMIFHKETYETPAMARGKRLEDEARKIYERKHNVKLITPVIESNGNSLIIASLDGCTEDLSLCIEIKCLGREKHELALKGEVPKEYEAQLQHIMGVMFLPEITYVSYNPDYSDNEDLNYKEIIVERNSLYLLEYFPKVYRFLNNLSSFEEPEKTERDFLDLSKFSTWNTLEEQYKYVLEQMTFLDFEKTRIREEMIKEAEDKNVRGVLFKLTKYVSKGRVNYNNIPELKDVDLELHRGPSIISYKITELC